MSIVDINSPAARRSSMDGIAVRKIALVAASAAMGGFLFGFDTAVINGAVDAIKGWSGAVSWLLGFSVAGALLGSAIGAWFAGPLADRCHENRCRYFLREFDWYGSRLGYRGFEHIPFPRWHCSWCGECNRPGLYRRGVAGLIPGTSWLPSAARYRHRYLRRAAW